MTASGRSVTRLLLVAALAGGTACARESIEEIETTAAVPVRVETARIGTVRDVLVVTGLVVPAPGAELTATAPEAAKIVALPHAVGDRVPAGGLLVRFDIPTLAAAVSTSRAALAQAQARVDAARANRIRVAGLLGQGVAAPRELEEADTRLVEAQSELEQARGELESATSLASRAEVSTPFAGIVTARFHNPGDFVEAGSAAVRIIDPSRQQVDASVPAADLVRVSAGRPARIFAGDQPAGVRATVLSSSPVVDPATSMATVRLGLTGRTGLTPGSTVRVEIDGAERAGVVVVSPEAIVTDGDEQFAMVVGADSKAHKRPVALGLVTRTAVEVASGVNDGDRIVVRGQDGLPDEATVTIEAP